MGSSQGTPAIPNGLWARQRLYHSVRQHDEPTQNVLDPVHRSEHFRNPLVDQFSQYERGEGGNLKSRSSRNAVSAYLGDNRFNFYALLPISAAMLEVSLLVYFYITYISLPPDPKTGALPRISPVYSTWPFTSCIGGTRQAVYKTFAFVVTGLYQSGSLIGLYEDWTEERGYWFRRVGAVGGCTSSALLIFLVFSSGNTSTHTHLFITAAKILATLTVKTNILICDYLDRRATPVLESIPAAIILRRWKEVIAALSFVFAIFADGGIYACTNADQIHTPGTTCFKIMAIAAPAEWAMSILWINFMLNMAYGFYTHGHISALVTAARSTESGPKATVYREKAWSPRAEDFELDEAPLLREDEYPAKALKSASRVGDPDVEALALGELTLVRGFA